MLCCTPFIQHISFSYLFCCFCTLIDNVHTYPPCDFLFFPTTSGCAGRAAPADFGHIGRHYGRTEAISKPPRMPERTRLGDEAVFMCGNPSSARREHAFALTVDGCWAVRSRLFNGTHDTGSRVCVCVCVRDTRVARVMQVHELQTSFNAAFIHSP